MLTFWIPTPFLTYIGRMNRMDIRQAWHEKLALNMIIWFICGGLSLEKYGPWSCGVSNSYSSAS